MKQLGSQPVYQHSEWSKAVQEPVGMTLRFPTKAKKGEEPEEWPTELRVREFPEVRA